VPELPDIEAYLAALRTRVVGKRLVRVRLGNAFFLRSVKPSLADAEGRRVRELRRIGKRIAIGLEDDIWLVIHLMIAGRLHWKDAHAKPTQLGSKRGPLAAFDFENRAQFEGSLVVTEAGSKRRASLTLVQGETQLMALDPGGIDVMGCSQAEFRAALSRENRTLKRALTDPRIVSGIGNAYSDEILHGAKLSPILQTHKLTDAQWAALFERTQSTLELWRSRLIAEANERFPEKVTAFRADMAVHGKFGKPCPACGQPVQRIRYADNETNYCVECQTGGKLLADRSLSRLLKSDWPKSLDELETLKRPGR
jgi:formamidopyrimidine-DNA glycosylase